MILLNIMKLAFLCIGFIPLVTAIMGRNARVAKAFKANNLTPDIYPVAPESFLDVIYPTAEVCLGEEINQPRLLQQPVINFDYKPGCNYTLIVTDPDVPSSWQPTLRSYLIWLEMNIVLKGKVRVSDIIASYVPPTPLPSSGFHRYVFTLYEQSRPMDIPAILSVRLGVKRFRFSVSTFAQENCLGDPIAGNFLRARTPALCDEYYCSSDNTCYKRPLTKGG